MLLYLVRHGMTKLNEQNIVQGNTDHPLSPTGLDQVQKLANHLKMVPFSEAWCGTQIRAKQTAEVLLEGNSRVLEVKVDDRLRARGMGSMEGKGWEEGVEYPEDAEEAAEVIARLHSWLQSLITTHTPLSSPAGTPRTPITPTDPGSGTILAVTHAECLIALLTILTRPPQAGEQQDQDQGKEQAILDLRIPHGVETSGEVGNTGVAILRIWWEDDGMGGMDVRGRLEGWGMDDHLLGDE